MIKIFFKILTILIISTTWALADGLYSYQPIYNGTVATATPADPTGTASATNVMMGLGASCVITPKFSSRVNITFVGSMSNSGTASATAIRLRQGTGTAPANAAAPVGNQLGNPFSASFPVGGQQMVFSMSFPVTGLVPGIATWFDIAVNTGGSGTGTVQNITCTAFEF